MFGGFVPVVAPFGPLIGRPCIPFGELPVGCAFGSESGVTVGGSAVAGDAIGVGTAVAEVAVAVGCVVVGLPLRMPR